MTSVDLRGELGEALGLDSVGPDNAPAFAREPFPAPRALAS